MKILMVCLGNICRSPLAEGILQQKLGSQHQVDSCGTSAYHEGEAPDNRSIEVAQNHHIDISQQKSRPFKPQDFEDFDRIYVMDKNNLQEILKRTNNHTHQAKVQLIQSENPHTRLKEIPDPYYGDVQDFEKVWELLDETTQYISTSILA